MSTPYYVYVIRCEDNSLYTGITTDVSRRFDEHCGKRVGRAKYTRFHMPVRVECVWKTADRSLASRLEYRIKTLSKAQKERLLCFPDSLSDVFGDLLDADAYRVIKNKECFTMKTIKDYVTTIPNFPHEGIMFRDITSVLQDKDGFQLAVNEYKARLEGLDFDAVAGIEARGFVFASVLSYLFNKPLILIRKKGKLPREAISEEYALEYGTAALEINKDALAPGDRVVLIDDLLATGGTVLAAAHLVEKLGGQVAKCLCLLELAGLNGRAKLAEYDVDCVATYEGI